MDIELLVEIFVSAGGHNPTSSDDLESSASSIFHQDNKECSIKDRPTNDRFDVFLCHNSEDKPEVKRIGIQLKERGLRPWLDEWELQPGLPWQPKLEECINKIDAAAIFIGPSGIGPWQHMEMGALLNQLVDRKCPVIPVILNGGFKLPELPLFLRNITWVDFRQNEPNPLKSLIWGITGERVESRVILSSGDDEGMIATGYPIAKNRILTARHALYPNGHEPRSIEVRWHHLTGAVRQWQPARIVEWEGGDEFDVALIECEFPENVDHWGMLSEEKPSDTMHWCSEGFAHAGKRDDGERRPVGMKGEVFSMADNAPEFELGANYEVNQDRHWKGASGSPVFVGDKIIGVIVSCPENFNARRLRATPLWRLLQKPGFCEAIGYDERKERLEWAGRELTSILNRSTEATEKLANSLNLDTRLIQLAIRPINF